MKYTQSIFIAGFTISLTGSLPPGLLNIIAVQLSGEKGTISGFSYAAGATVAEMMVVWFALTCINWFNNKKNFFAVLEWMTAFILVLFASACSIAAYLVEDLGKIIPRFMFSAFMTGLLFSLLNPVHIPFWLGWSNFLSGRGTLQRKKKSYLLYITGIGLGTLGGFTIYITGGPYMLKLIQHNSAVINLVFGSILTIAAFLQIRRMMRVPVQVRYAEVLKQRDKINSPF